MTRCTSKRDVQSTNVSESAVVLVCATNATLPMQANYTVGCSSDVDAGTAAVKFVLNDLNGMFETNRAHQ